MEDFLIMLFWIAIIGGGIVNSVIKARNKARENDPERTPQAESGKTASGGGSMAQRRSAHPVRKSLAEALEELSGGGVSSSSAREAWPVTTPSRDEYSFEGGGGTMDGRWMRTSVNTELPGYEIEDAGYGVEDAGYEVEGQFVDQVAAYESLAVQRAGRTTYSGSSRPAAGDKAALRKEGTTPTHVDTPDEGGRGGVFDDGFDLRRAVIEAEILRPKYLS